MTPGTLLLILQILQLVEAGIPVGVGLAKQLQAALAEDPGAAEAYKKINRDALALSVGSLAKIDAWFAAHEEK